MTTIAPAPETKRPAVDRYGPWVALYAAVGLTASGEFQLAALAGFPGWIAWALPTAIDVYVIQAMRRHRDVAAALVLMVGTNALYHLAAARLFGVTPDGVATWWLIVAVSAIAPLIVWRVHRITETRVRSTSGAVRRGIPLTAVATAPAAICAGPDGLLAISAVAPQRDALPDATEAPSPHATKTLPERLVASGTDATSTPRSAPVAPPQSAVRPPRKAATKAPQPATGGSGRGAAVAAIRDLYDALGRRPIESEMVAELIRIKAKYTSRQFANKVRTEIETAHPELAALGSDNVRPLTGSDG